jgi:hypothetical protein
MGLLCMGGSRAVEQQWRGYNAPPLKRGERMRPSTSYIFHTTQRCQARLLLVCFTAWTTPLNKKKKGG